MAQFYVTTPIYYVNGEPHIGHVYTTLLADVLARHHRLRGDETFFLTGTDEHAAKVVEAAEENGVTPQAWADRCASAFSETFARLGMSQDDFIRTSEARHKERVTEYVTKLKEKGDVYLGSYEGWYDAGQEEYVTDAAAKDSDYKSPVNGKPLVKKQEENWFFRLSAYQDKLLALYQERPDLVRPKARRNEIVSRIEGGLRDVPMSRTGQGEWGIGVPGDEAHTIYVWIDALFNYLTAVDNEERRHLWPANVQIIAKDILWFHAAIWPALLLALEEDVFGKLYAHSFWISEGRKMSKSLGNFVGTEKLDQYVETFGLDSLRYFLAAAGPIGTNDSDFAEAKFIETYNTELANTLGNSASRVLNMTTRYFDGVLPEPGGDVEGSDELRAAAEYGVKKHMASMDECDTNGAVAAAMEIVRAVDGYIERTAPFKLAKDETRLGEVATILYHCAESLRIAATLLWPVMPSKIEELWSRFGVDYASELAAGRGSLEAWTAWGAGKPGAQLVKGDPLFQRYKVEA